MNDHQSMFEWLVLMMMECQGLDINGIWHHQNHVGAGMLVIMLGLGY